MQIARVSWTHIWSHIDTDMESLTQILTVRLTQILTVRLTNVWTVRLIQIGGEVRRERDGRRETAREEKGGTE